jgi:hypothetical protein
MSENSPARHRLVAQHVAVGHGVIGEFAPQRHLQHARVHHRRRWRLIDVEVECQRDAVAQRAANAVIDRVFHVRGKLQHAVIDHHEGGAHLEVARQRPALRTPRGAASATSSSAPPLFC